MLLEPLFGIDPMISSLPWIMQLFLIPRTVANATANKAVLDGISQARDPHGFTTNVASLLLRFHYSNSETLSRDDCVAWQTVRNIDADPSVYFREDLW